MRTTLNIFTIVCYILGVGAIIEGACKGILLNGIITAAAMFWLGSALNKEGKKYDTESN